jgi:cytochrome c biogenesis protein CcmG/thiol:disulfide interchange protein DsbE
VVPTNELEGYQRSRTRRAITWGLAVLALGIIAYLATRPAGVREVPDFTLPQLGGGTLSSRELRGSPVVLNFFASWCLPCREEAPLLERTWQVYKDRGVRFVGVDIEDTERSARHFVASYDISYPVVRDEDKKLARALDVYGLPQTFFIDENWTLLDTAEGQRVGGGRGQVVALGAIDGAELRRQIEGLLADG